MAKYVFDSNIFINLQRRQPIDIYPSLWKKTWGTNDIWSYCIESRSV